MRDDLIKAARELKATTKTSSSEGPFAWTDGRMVRVWIILDSYGRVHHVTGDLVLTEKMLAKLRMKLTGVEGAYFDVGDVYVDGLPGGRNRMLVEFYATLKSPASEGIEDAVATALGRFVTWKTSPPT